MAALDAISRAWILAKGFPAVAAELGISEDEVRALLIDVRDPEPWTVEDEFQTARFNRRFFPGVATDGRRPGPSPWRLPPPSVPSLRPLRNTETACRACGAVAIVGKRPQHLPSCFVPHLEPSPAETEPSP